jgi:hypothetical protein
VQVVGIAFEMADEDLPLARRIAKSATDAEKVLLISWLESLLAIKHSNLGAMKKGKQALEVTAGSKVIFPILKTIALETGLSQFDAKDIKFSSLGDVRKYLQKVWADRSLPAKMGISVGTLALIFFGSQGAGIAALGSAIAVPLWIVFGAGATFATVLYEEIKRKKG